MLKEESIPRAGGGGMPRRPTPAGEEPAPSVENFVRKKGWGWTSRDGFAGADDEQRYVEECAFVISWVREMMKRAGGDDGKEARWARLALREVMWLAMPELTVMASGKGDGEDWARRLVAGLDVWISKNREKLGGKYEEVRRELGVLRKDVLFSRSVLYRALQRELWRCSVYRGEISFSEALEQLPVMERVVRGEVPGEYEVICALRVLSVESLPEWEREVWKLLKAHNPGLLEEIRTGVKRFKMVEVNGDGATRYEPREKKLTWKLLRPQVHRHLKAIAGVSG